MTTFLDGPAADVCLTLRRAPLYLRVCKNQRTGDWDALDQLGDKPKRTEELHCYVRITPAYRVIRLRPGGRFPLADYRHLPIQPAEEVMRDTNQWQAWCMAEEAKATKQRDDFYFSGESRR